MQEFENHFIVCLLSESLGYPHELHNFRHVKFNKKHIGKTNQITARIQYIIDIVINSLYYHGLSIS